MLLAWPGGLLASVSAKSVDESFWETFKQKLIEKGCDEAATGFVRLVLAQRRILNAETFCHVVVNEQFKFIPEACFLARLLGTILYVAIHEQMSVYDECVVSLSDSLSLSLSLSFPISLSRFSSFHLFSLALSLSLLPHVPRVLCCVAQAIPASDVRMFCNVFIQEIAGSEENLAEFKGAIALKVSLSNSDQSTASGSGGGATESSRAGDSASAD